MAVMKQQRVTVAASRMSKQQREKKENDWDPIQLAYC